MPDLSHKALPPVEQRERVDLGALETRLRDYTEQWVPKEFPQGWRSDSGDEWVVGDISGKRPSGNGSCRIKLRGDHAGDHYDFSLGKGGQVFSTIKERFRLGAGEVIREALRIIEECGVAVERIEGQRPAGRAPAASGAARNTARAAAQWSWGGPLAGTIGARYFNGRGLAVPKTDDLRFSDGVSRMRSGQPYSQPAILALFRYPDGEPSGGIHRIFLHEDGAGHDGKQMLGPTDSAVVMLGQPTRGLLGIAEGIETCVAAASLFGVPGWAAGSSGGLGRFGEGLLRHPGWAWQAGIRRLLIWADANNAGESAGRDLLAACRSAGVDAQLWLPRGGDDFADDNLKGLLPSLPVATTRAAETLIQREPGETEPDYDWNAT
jgi:putative DNA primase/helicase